VRALLRGTPATTRIVLRTRADRVTDVLKLAGEVRGTSGAVLVVAHDRPRRVDGDAELSGREPVHLCLDAATESDALDPAVRAAVAGLLADGVPTKTAANALATLTGWDRRRAYAAVLDWPAI
jgi:hypothetical protein